ncbi:MAG: DegV family protein [Clostridiaceae bacterium]
MQKIAIFTDSACDLKDNVLKEYNIRFLPLRIIYTDKEYRDRVEIGADEVYDNLVNEVPKTSLPSGEDISNFFKELIKEGYTHAIGVMISSGLSGTANSVKLMAENFPEIETFLFDTKNLSIAEGILAVEAAKMLKAGKTFEEIVNILPTLRETVDTYYIVDTLEYLIKGGRIGKVSGTIGQMLNLKPIISVNSDGVYYTIEKARGMKQGYNKLIELLKENLEKTKCRVWVMHGGVKEECLAILERVKDFSGIVELDFGQISPALGVHTGKGLIGICIQRIM